MQELTSFLIKHFVDILLVAAFFYVFYFCKPSNSPSEEIDPEEAPNELEQILITEEKKDDEQK